MTIKNYVDFIAEQSKHGKTLRSTDLSEAVSEDPKLSAKMKSDHGHPHTDEKMTHVASHGTQHLYSAEHDDPDDHSHHTIHDTSTGKNHHVSLPPGHVFKKEVAHETKGVKLHSKIEAAMRKGHNHQYSDIPGRGRYE